MDAFISYKRKPSASLAMLLQEKLRNQFGIDAYVDTTRTDSTKVTFPERLMEAIAAAPVFVCLLGEGTLESEWVLKEIVEAHRLKKRCIPVFQESYTPHPSPPEAVNYLLSFDGVHVMDLKNIFIDESMRQLGLLIKPRTKQRFSIPLVFGTLLVLLLIIASIIVLPSFLPKPTSTEGVNISNLATDAPTATDSPTENTATDSAEPSLTNTTAPTDSAVPSPAIPTDTPQPTNTDTPRPSPTLPTNTPQPSATRVDTTATTIGSVPAYTTKSICLVTDVGTIDDGSFNQLTYEGIMAAGATYPFLLSYIETQAQTDYAANIERCVDNGAELVITIAFLMQDATIEAAIANPDILFVGVDQNNSVLGNMPQNFMGLMLREDQSAYLMGALAALVANINDKDTIAGIYGIDIPAVKRFRNGFEQGALLVNPDWVVGENILGEYASSFIDPALGREMAQAMIANDAAVIFAAAGPTGSAAIFEAANQGIFVIGSEFDEYNTTFNFGQAHGAEYIISSALKPVDKAVSELISLFFENPAALRVHEGGNYIYNSGGDFAPVHDSDIDPSVSDFVGAIKTLLKENCLSTNVDYNTGDLLSPEEIAAFIPADGCDELTATLLGTNDE